MSNPNSYTITPMLDEDDSTPVFEVKNDGNQWSTNTVTLEDAFEIIRKRVEPARTLEQIARDWVTAHGTQFYDDMAEDIRAEVEYPLSENQMDSILNMICHAQVSITFPYGHGVPRVK